MQKLLLTGLLVAICLSPVWAQENAYDYGYEDIPDSTPVSYTNLPKVEFEHYNLELMRSFYPIYYKSEYTIRKDIRSVTREDSSFIALWDSVGNSVLYNIKELSGIEWVEDEIDVHLVKFLPSLGLYDPLVMPWEGVKTRDYIEAAPTGWRRMLNLIRLLSGRNVRQIFYPECTRHYLSDHPLLQQSAYRFDNVAMALALETASRVIDPDTLRIIVSSSSWQSSFPGWVVFENHFLYTWPLSAEMPLAQFLSDEPYNSPLIELTRPPRQARITVDKGSRKDKLTMGAGTGRLGFSVTKANNGLLEVVDVDSTKIAYGSGLMSGDQIRKVNGETVRTARDLMSKIIDKIDEEGVYMIVLRDQEEIGLLLLPPSEY